MVAPLPSLPQRVFEIQILKLSLSLPTFPRSQRTSTYCVSYGPGTSTSTRLVRSCVSRSPGGNSTRWTTCWRPGLHRRSSRTTTPGAGTITTEVKSSFFVFFFCFCKLQTWIYHLEAHCWLKKKKKSTSEGDCWHNKLQVCGSCVYTLGDNWIWIHFHSFRHLCRITADQMRARALVVHFFLFVCVCVA